MKQSGKRRAAVPRQRSRRQRLLVENLKRAAIWLFIAVFVSSVVGVALITIRQSTR